MDMKRDDRRRAMPRVRVHFRARFSDSTRLEGKGRLLDLSLGGCCIQSPVSLGAGVSLEVWIYAPDIVRPLEISAARVQWVSGQTFGLAFSQMTLVEQHRLGQTVNELIGDGPSAG